jgi:simple sugar transport system substrate-binding protein
VNKDRNIFKLLIIAALLALLSTMVIAQDDGEATEEPDMEMTEEAAEEMLPQPEAYSPEDVSQEYTMATVVKVTGIAWFNRMGEGIEQFNEDYPGIEAFQQGPSQADAAQQVQVIEDILAQNPDSLCVVPFQPEAVEPVLQRARDNGVVVITHEASNIENADFDIEAFDNAGYGIHLMDALAERMGEEGQYTVFVGSLTSTTHNQWVDAAIAHQEENYPDMEFVGGKNETADNSQNAYEIMQELLITYPELKGVQGSASTDVVGVGQAVNEAGLNDEIAVVGTSVPSIARDGLMNGSIDLISFWDPALAGYACNQLALQVLEGTVPEPLFEGEQPEETFGLGGIGLALEGYGDMTIDGKVISGNAWIDVTEENLDEYDF